jgi:hypothetical protein
MTKEKKSLFDKAIDALTDRDEKEAAAKAAAEKAAAEKAAAEKAAAQKAAAAKVAAEKAAAEKAAVQKAAAQKAAAAKAAADRAAAQKIAAAKAVAARAAAAPKKGIVMVRSLHIRKDHSTTSPEVGGLVKDKEVTILETWSDGKNTWAKLGPDQWAAIVYNGETLIQLN